MSEWRECKLGDVATFHYGKGLKADNRIEGAIPVFSSAGLTGYHNQALVNTKGLIIGRKGTIGKVYYSDKPFWCIDTAYFILQNDEIYNLNYLYYKLQTLGLEELNEDSAVPGLNRETAYSQDISLPPLPEQRAIATVLSSLDDKIDLLHRQNKTLEGLAETLFRQWFIEEAQADWEVGTLGDCCEKITKGTTPTTLKKNFASSGINFIKVNAIDERGNFLSDKIEFIDEETNNLLSRSQLKEGDILYSIAGTIGRLIVVGKDILPANVNQALAIIRVDSRVISPIYIKYYLKDKGVMNTLHSKIVHAVQPNLSLGVISNTLISLPPKELLVTFQETAYPLELKISSNKVQIRTLESLRDTLLPKLMSGEVRVKTTAD